MTAFLLNREYSCYHYKYSTPTHLVTGGLCINVDGSNGAPTWSYATSGSGIMHSSNYPDSASFTVWSNKCLQACGYAYQHASSRYISATGPSNGSCGSVSRTYGSECPIATSGRAPCMSSDAMSVCPKWKSSNYANINTDTLRYECRYGSLNEYTGALTNVTYIGSQTGTIIIDQVKILQIYQ